MAYDATIASDPKYKKYSQQVEKCLATFENMQEWPDLIAFLKQLLKVNYCVCLINETTNSCIRRCNRTHNSKRFHGNLSCLSGWHSAWFRPYRLVCINEHWTCIHIFCLYWGYVLVHLTTTAIWLTQIWMGSPMVWNVSLHYAHLGYSRSLNMHQHLSRCVLTKYYCNTLYWL